MGRARFLSYGPYFHLPVGLWAVEVIVEVHDCYSNNRIGFDVHAASILAARTTTLPGSGVFACDMKFRVADSSLPIEVRLQLLTGAIEGRLLLRGAHVRRVDELEEMNPGWPTDPHPHKSKID
jgi:hypothetical protein